MLEKIKKEFYFGEKVDGYNIPVLNEREIRAGAGILFLFSIIMFFVGCVGENFWAVKIFGTYFLIEFFIRVLINTKFAPSLILGRIFVSNQKPEYVGAPQKRFAWSIGLFLGIIFFVSTVLLNSFGPWNVILCFICMTFLYFESVFGICWGCQVYEKFFHKKAEYCPGGICEIKTKEKIQKISKIQLIILFFTILTIILFLNLNIEKQKRNNGCFIQKENSCKIF